MRDDALGGWEVTQPECKIEERQSVVEESTTARFDAPPTPPRLRALVMVRASTDAGELAELTPAQESGERLDVAEPTSEGEANDT